MVDNLNMIILTAYWYNEHLPYESNTIAGECNISA